MSQELTIFDLCKKYGQQDDVVFAYMENRLSEEERFCLIHKANLSFIETFAHVWAQKKFVESLEKR